MSQCALRLEVDVGAASKRCDHVLILAHRSSKMLSRSSLELRSRPSPSSGRSQWLDPASLCSRPSRPLGPSRSPLCSRLCLLSASATLFAPRPLSTYSTRRLPLAMADASLPPPAAEPFANPHADPTTPSEQQSTSLFPLSQPRSSGLHDTSAEHNKLATAISQLRTTIPQQLHSIDSKFAKIEQLLARFDARFDRLEAAGPVTQQATSSAPTAPPPPSSPAPFVARPATDFPPALKLPASALPPLFNGSNRAETTVFLNRLDRHYLSDQYVFQYEFNKVTFAAVHLRGTAEAWFHMACDRTPAIRSDFALFKKELLAAFGPWDQYPQDDLLLA